MAPIKQIQFIFYIFLLWLPVASAEYPVDLQGEWIHPTCIKIKGSIYYSIVRLAFFSENEVVQSWQVYDDSHCTKIRGAGWDRWVTKFKEAPSTEPGMFYMDNIFIEGTRERKCYKSLNIMIKQDDTLWLGDRSEIERRGECEKRPTEVSEYPFTFSHSIEQTIEEYIESLEHFWINPMAQPT